MNQQLKIQFSWRALTSMCMSVAFLAMVVSGGILFLAPSTRVAREVNWQVWGLAKGDWQNLHLVFSALFFVVAIVHTVFNWRLMLNYLKMRVAERRGIRWEWLVALVLGALIWAGTRSKLPPFTWLLDWRETLHGSQCGVTSSPEHSPTRGQGGFGQKTLAQYCVEQGLNLDAAVARLRAKGIKASGGDTFRLIADKNNLERPSEIPKLLEP